MRSRPAAGRAAGKNGQPRRSSVCDLLVKPTWHSSTARFVAFRARHADRDRRDFIELRVDVGGVGDDGNDGRDGRGRSHRPKFG